MFDITSSKLLLLGIVALLVIGPKDFPALLRTIGKYVGIIRGHAKDFRAQFDEAMRESELDQLKKDVENIANETEASFSDAGRSVDQTLDEARRTMDAPADLMSTPLPDPMAHDANGLPIAPPDPAPAAVDSNGAGETPLETAAPPVASDAPAQTPSETLPAPDRSVEKSGA
jgi:sec-independent protein translocase protein TatB